MKITHIGIAIICCIFSVSAFAGDDWRLTYFDAALKLSVEYELKEAEILRSADGDSDDFYEIWLPLQNAGRKIDRYIFILKLNVDPDSIVIDGPYGWRQQKSRDEEIALAERDDEFRRIFEEFLSRRDAYKNSSDVIARHNMLATMHEEEIAKLHKELHEKLTLLQTEFNEKMANKSQERTE